MSWEHEAKKKIAEALEMFKEEERNIKIIKENEIKIKKLIELKEFIDSYGDENDTDNNS